jgi:hypothetical protein
VVANGFFLIFGALEGYFKREAGAFLRRLFPFKYQENPEYKGVYKGCE